MFFVLLSVFSFSSCSLVYSVMYIEDTNCAADQWMQALWMATTDLCYPCGFFPGTWQTATCDATTGKVPSKQFNNDHCSGEPVNTFEIDIPMECTHDNLGTCDYTFPTEHFFHIKFYYDNQCSENMLLSEIVTKTNVCYQNGKAVCSTQGDVAMISNYTTADCSGTPAHTWKFPKGQCVLYGDELLGTLSETSRRWIVNNRRQIQMYAKMPGDCVN